MGKQADVFVLVSLFLSEGYEHLPHMVVGKLTWDCVRKNLTLSPPQIRPANICFCPFFHYLHTETTSEQYHSHLLAFFLLHTHSFCLLVLSLWKMPVFVEFFFFLRKTSGPRLNISSHKWAGCKHSCTRLHQASLPRQLPSDIPWRSASMNLPGAHPGSPPVGVICHTRNMPNDQHTSQEMTCTCTFKMELSQQDV